MLWAFGLLYCTTVSIGTFLNCNVLIANAFWQAIELCVRLRKPEKIAAHGQHLEYQGDGKTVCCFAYCCRLILKFYLSDWGLIEFMCCHFYYVQHTAKNVFPSLLSIYLFGSMLDPARFASKPSFCPQSSR